MTKKDYYELLGIARDANDTEIKKAYRKLAHEFHPDKNPGDKQSEDKFKEITEAYEILSNSEKRAMYDRYGHNYRNSAAGGGGGGFEGFGGAGFGDIIEDIFDGFFGGSGGRRGGGGGARRQSKGSDLEFNVNLSFEEAAFGVSREIKINKKVSCTDCAGTGSKDRKSTTCPTCQGTGKTRYQQGFFVVSTTCATCRGEGHVIKNVCPKCEGNGFSRGEKKIEVKIPQGVDNGNTLRVANEGNEGPPGGIPGDLFVNISVNPHPFFERKGTDVFCRIPISFTQAALGAEIPPALLPNAKRTNPSTTRSVGAPSRKFRGARNFA
jgi:molecular chaperone DnaJ